MNEQVKRIVGVSLAAVSALTLTTTAFASDAPNLKFLDEIMITDSSQTQVVTEETTEGGETAEATAEGTTTTKTDATKATEATKTEATTATAEEATTEETTTVTTTTTTTNSGRNVSSAKVSYSNILASINKHKAKNSSAEAWLYVPNTNMNFTIINPTNSNNYYEKRSWDGVHYPNNYYKNFKETASFADYRVVLGDGWERSSKNIVLYGHNWTNLKAPYAIGNVPKHIMFGQLPSYTSMEFAKQNPYVYFSTDKNEGVWKIFSVAYIENDPSVFRYNTPNPDAQTYTKMLSEYKARSLYDFDVDLNTGDRILTLDTCIRNYAGVGGDQRFVVVARLLRDGESDTQAVTVKKNPNVKYPKF